jgi:hypothetical protein
MRRHRPDWAAELGAMRLSGARFRKARWNPGGRTLELVLRVPEADGWAELLVRYRGVERLEPAVPALARIVEDVAVVLSGHALSAAAGCWQHRLESDAGVVLVRFGDLELGREPVAGPSDPFDGGHRFEVLSC